MSLTCRSLCNELFCETDQESKQTSPKTLLQKCPIQKISWSAFSHIWIKYRDLQSKFLYSVQIREIRTWKTQNTNTFHSVKPLKSCCRPFCSVKSWCLWHVIGSATIRFDCSTRKQFIRTEIYSKVSRVIAIF